MTAERAAVNPAAERTASAGALPGDRREQKIFCLDRELAPMPDRPNVLLLIFDTLRRDALSRYSDAASTPAFDGVAARGTTFERAFAAGPFTPPSHGAMFSGRYPSDTGFAGPWPTMPDGVTLLAERLGEAGYETLGIPGPAKMGSATGLDRGFDDYYEVYEEVAEGRRRRTSANCSPTSTSAGISSGSVRAATTTTRRSSSSGSGR